MTTQLDRLEALVRAGTWHQPELQDAADALPDLIRVARAAETARNEAAAIVPAAGHSLNTAVTLEVAVFTLDNIRLGLDFALTMSGLYREVKS